jgi:xylulose-5-phosphate/fructose-6-phosphate phosphoketolase
VDVYFPPDGNTTLAVLEHCLASTRQINIIVAGKTLEPRWLTPQLAKKAVEAGIMTWDFASDDNPDIVLAAAGDYLTKESLAAISIVKKEWPDIRLRFLNILSLTSCGLGRGGMCLTPEGFNSYFTPDKPVICNFHGYPETLKAIIFDYINSSPQRFSVHGYIEAGSTTTAFDMHVRNQTSRYHLACEVFEKMAAAGKIPYEEAKHLIAAYQGKIGQNTDYIKQNGVDLPEVEQWRWTN